MEGSQTIDDGVKARTRAEAFQTLSPLQNALIGTAAGTIEVTILQPMLYCKNATQQKLGLSFDPRVLYRGLVMSVGNMAILSALQFPLTNVITAAITGGSPRKLSDIEMIAAGFGGGALSGIACCPMEGIMIQQQRFGQSLIATAGNMLRTYGAASFGRGMITSVGREGLFTMGYMGVAPVISQKIREDLPSVSPYQGKLLGAVGAGLIAATLSHPLDTIKTCMQGDQQRATYDSFSNTLSKLRSEGGLFRGWSWRTGRMICAMFIMSECKERLSPLFFPDHFDGTV